MLSNSLSTFHNWKKDPQPCELCQQDDSIPEDVKARLYKEKAKLQKHMAGYIHTRRAQWDRLHKPASGEHITCPYCDLIDPDSPSKYAHWSHMIRHITSGKPKTSAEHERLKTADGWYDDDWMAQKDENQVHKRQKDQWNDENRRKRIKFTGISYSDDVELLIPIPYPTIPGIVLGGLNKVYIEEIEGVSSFSEVPRHGGGIPEEYQHLVRPDSDIKPIIGSRLIQLVRDDDALINFLLHVTKRRAQKNC